MENIPCQERVKFQHTEDSKVFDHQCCLFTPHKGTKHYIPTITCTCGGDRVTHDIDGVDITKTWSGFIEPL